MQSVLLIGFGAALGAAATYYVLSEHLAAKILANIQRGFQSAANVAGGIGASGLGASGTAAKKL